jgi:hypothetical protein
VDLALRPPAPVSSPRDLGAIRDICDLPPYIAEVEKAAAEGVQTSQEFAGVRDISISSASERFRIARKLGWVVPVDGRYLPRQGIRCALDSSRPGEAP